MKKLIKIFLIVTLVVVSLIALVVFLRNNPSRKMEGQAHISPQYAMENIEGILGKNIIAEEEYKVLFMQTGLSKIAVNYLLEKEKGFETIKKFQKKFFANPNYFCQPNSLISSEEHIVNYEVEEISYGDMAPLKNGDILLTKSSHTLNWRNGHAAIVIDADNGKTLESVVLGEPACVQTTEKWKSFPNYLVLRPKDDYYGTKGQMAANFSKQYLIGANYNLTVGFLSSKKVDKDIIEGTHCSHLVWRAYMEQNIDLDVNEGIIITPKDIANSPELEVVQVYGMEVESPWN